MLQTSVIGLRLIRQVRISAQLRWRHTSYRDLSPAERLKKSMRGTPNLVSIRGPAEGSQLRKEIAQARTADAIMQLLEAAPALGAPEIAKAMQRCGEMRDRASLERVHSYSKERSVVLSLQAYGIMITAAARTARGADGSTSLASERANALQLGKKSFEEMVSCGHAPLRPQFGAALGLCAKSGDPQWARSLWSNMLNSKIQPSIVEYTQYLLALASEGTVESWELLDKEILNMTAHNVQPDAPFLAALIDVAAMQNNMSRAESLWAEVMPRVPKVNSSPYNAMAKAFLINGYPLKALELREEMERNNVDFSFRTLMYEAQARLLLLQENPSDRACAKAIQDLVARADEFRLKESNARTVSRAEVHTLNRINDRASQLIAGETLRMEDVRVMDWPWRPLENTAGLPTGWCEAVDPSTNRSYYWLASDPAGTTTWDRPI